MSLFKEKRAGKDRRSESSQLRESQVERRVSERRQISLEEISFIEWASQFAQYKKQGPKIK